MNMRNSLLLSANHLIHRDDYFEIINFDLQMMIRAKTGFYND